MGLYSPSPSWFSLNNSKTFVPNLVSITCPSLQILGKTHTGVFPISGFLIPEPVMILTWNLDQSLKLTREIKPRQKILAMTLCREIVTSLSFFGFLANLEQSRGRIPDTEHAKVMFSVIVTIFVLQKLKTELNSLTQLLHYCFE